MDKLLKELRKGIQSIHNDESTGYRIFVESAFSSVLLAWKRINDLRNGAGTWAAKDFFEPSPYDYCSESLQSCIRIYCEIVRNSNPFADVLSELHETILLTGRKGDGLGKFFTPTDVVDVVSTMTLPDVEIRAIDSVKSVGDPCCGAGAFPLGLLRRLAEVDKTKVQMIDLILNDIDEFACKSTVLQVLANSLIHGLSVNEMWMYRSNVLTEYNKPGSLFLRVKSQSNVLGESRVMTPLERFLSRLHKQDEQNLVIE